MGDRKPNKENVTQRKFEEKRKNRDKIGVNKM